MCSEDSHGSAAEYITHVCQQDELGDANNIDQARFESNFGLFCVSFPLVVSWFSFFWLIFPPNLDQITRVMGPPHCTMLQAAVMAQCDYDCINCDVHSVRDVVGDCIMETGEPAREVSTQASPTATTLQGCL